MNLKTGKACGLHFSGTYLDNNYVVTSAAPFTPPRPARASRRLRGRAREPGRHGRRVLARRFIVPGGSPPGCDG